MPTGNRVIVVMEHPARKYVAMVRKLFGEYDEVVLTARGRHFSRLAEVIKLLRDGVSVGRTELKFADQAPELWVYVTKGGGGD